MCIRWYQVALFGENGPCSVSEDGTNTITNPYSWNSNASILYIDQPAGTGFSYGLGMDHSEAGVARDMYDFLQQFFKGHPQYAKLPFFAFGESYAGHCKWGCPPPPPLRLLRPTARATILHCPCDRGR
eukprot:COSAG06_NODE_12980_length_1306_cov_1.173985_2_plen_128_part_00